MAPTGVVVTIDNGSTHTSTLSVNLDILATGATEIRFSNNSFTWTAFETFFTNKPNWDLSSYGGNQNPGGKTVYVQVRDGADNRVTVTDTIRYDPATPRVKLYPSPSQRQGTFLADIPFTGYDEYGNECSLTVYEFSLSGDFIGEQKTMTPKTHDPLNDPVTSLLFSPNGTDYNFVWDMLADIPEGEVSDTVQIRMQAAHGNDNSFLAISQQFLIDLRPVDPITGPCHTRNDNIEIKSVFTDRYGIPTDPSPDAPEITSINDPSGNEYVTTPLVAIQQSVGTWSVPFQIPDDAEFGQWSAKWEYVFDFVSTVEFYYFGVIKDGRIFSPIGNDTCVVYGQIVNADESPLPDILVQFIPHHLSDREMGNTTDISTNIISAPTDNKGVFKVELIRNMELIIYIEELNYKQYAKVPDQDTVDYKNMLLTLPTPTRDKFGNRI